MNQKPNEEQLPPLNFGRNLSEKVGLLGSSVLFHQHALSVYMVVLGA